MRWAINYAIDRNEIVSFAFNDTTIPARHFFPSYPALNRYVDLLEQKGLYEKYPLLEHNVEKAKTIIESKGYQLNANGMYEKEGQPLTFNFSVANDTAFRNMGEILQQQFQRVGIKSEMQAQDYGGWYDTLLVGHFTAMVGWWSCGSVNEPWASMDTFNPRWLKPIDQRTGEGQNIWRWSGKGAEKYGRLVDEIGSLPLGDPHIEGLFVEAMDIWLQELPVIPLVQAGVLIPFNSTYWTGWPTAKNNYIHPPTWWQSSHEIIHNLQPTQP
jgi:peptide/nickel transport system substrate-binding protein